MIVALLAGLLCAAPAAADMSGPQDARCRSRLDHPHRNIAQRAAGEAAAVRLHDVERPADTARRQRLLKPVNVTVHHRRDIAIDDGRGEPRVFADLRQRLAGEINLGLRRGLGN